MSKTGLERLYGAIRDVPDFPEPGIVFKDITPLLLDSELLSVVVTRLAERYRPADVEKVVAIESRGFIFGAPLAMQLDAGLVLARKAGKLPWKRHRVEYALEYGTDVIEVHTDSIHRDERVLVVDDVLATGGTAEAAGRVVREMGGALVGYGFLMELEFLNGRHKLDGAPVESLLQYG